MLIFFFEFGIHSVETFRTPPCKFGKKIKVKYKNEIWPKSATVVYGSVKDLSHKREARVSASGLLTEHVGSAELFELSYLRKECYTYVCQ